MAGALSPGFGGYSETIQMFFALAVPGRTEPRLGDFTMFSGCPCVFRGAPRELFRLVSVEGDAGLDLLGDLVDEGGEVGVGLHLGLDLVAGVHDRGVVLAAEILADLRRGALRERARQVHGD